MYVFGSGRCGWRGGEWMRELGLGFTNPVGTGGVLDMCLRFGCGGVGGVGGEWVQNVCLAMMRGLLKPMHQCPQGNGDQCYCLIPLIVARVDQR